MQQWEYTVVDSYQLVRLAGSLGTTKEGALNELGAQGWELVAVSRDSGGDPVLYFKRPRL
jgi:hypothetical protein